MTTFEQLPLPITPTDAVHHVIRPALALLPAKMESAEAIALILAIMLQEGGRGGVLKYRWQVIDLARPEVKGPARGLAQFELGGGVRAIYRHPASRAHLLRACNTLAVPFEPAAIWRAMESNDALAVVCARLLLWTDAAPLPVLADVDGAWRYYLRNWRPGAYTRGSAEARRNLEAKFHRNHATALAALRGE